jgi:scyllo-inositol 2-dehydrogenase (NADP+)
MRVVIETVVVGYGLAGRCFHAPLIRRQPGLRLRGIKARDPNSRAEAAWDALEYASLEEALRLQLVRCYGLGPPDKTPSR